MPCGPPRECGGAEGRASEDKTRALGGSRSHMSEVRGLILVIEPDVNPSLQPIGTVELSHSEHSTAASIRSSVSSSRTNARSVVGRPRGPYVVYGESSVLVFSVFSRCDAFLLLLADKMDQQMVFVIFQHWQNLVKLPSDHSVRWSTDWLSREPLELDPQYRSAGCDMNSLTDCNSKPPAQTVSTEKIDIQSLPNLMSPMNFSTKFELDVHDQRSYGGLLLYCSFALLNRQRTYDSEGTLLGHSFAGSEVGFYSVDIGTHTLGTGLFDPVSTFGVVELYLEPKLYIQEQAFWCLRVEDSSLDIVGYLDDIFLACIEESYFFKIPQLEHFGLRCQEDTDDTDSFLSSISVSASGVLNVALVDDKLAMKTTAALGPSSTLMSHTHPHVCLKQFVVVK
ncbi:hypothetical protein Tco_0083664 [Tanacetum coccineum]